MTNYFHKRRICLIYLHDLGKISPFMCFQQKCPEFPPKMSGILDPRIPPFRRSGVQVCVIWDIDSGGVEKTNVETKVGGVQAEQCRIFINLEVSACTHMSLPISFMFSYFSTKPILDFQMTFCNLICVVAVYMNIITFTSRVKLSDLDVTLEVPSKE